MLNCDETKEVRVILNKLDKMIIDIEYGDTDEVMEKGIDTLKMVKTSYKNFVSELARAERNHINSIIEDLKPRGNADMPKDIVCNCTKEQEGWI